MKRVCSSRINVLIAHAKGSCSTTNRRHSCIATGPSGYSTSQRDNKSPCIAETTAVKSLALSLFKAGTLHDTSDCYVTSSEFQTLPELRGTTRTTLDAPKLYVPDNIIVVTEYEAEQLQSITPTEVQQLNDKCSNVYPPDNIRHGCPPTHPSDRILTTNANVLVHKSHCLSLRCYNNHNPLSLLLFYSRNSPSTVSEPDTTARPSPRPRDTIEPRNEESQRVVFASYSTQPSVYSSNRAYLFVQQPRLVGMHCASGLVLTACLQCTLHSKTLYLTPWRC